MCAVVEHELGTLEKGKIADLIVVEGDPLEDLSVLKHDLKMVVHSGVGIRDDRPEVKSIRRGAGRRVSGNQ